MTEQGTLFEHKQTKHAALLRKRTKPGDYRRKVEASLRAFMPVKAEPDCCGQGECGACECAMNTTNKP
jgi:hypothetical protein